MKKINIRELKKKLTKLSDDDSKKTIIANNAELYNDLITEYKQDKDKKNLYIIYQLNGMLLKQIVELEKVSDTTTNDDKFNTFMDGFKQRIEKR